MPITIWDRLQQDDPLNPIRFIGWYSREADEKDGTSIWRKPDGQLVQITCVTRWGEPHGTFWKDIVCVGPVEELVEAKPASLAWQWQNLTDWHIRTW